MKSIGGRSLFLCVLSLGCAEPELPANQVRTANGIVEGVPTGQPGVQAFLGIPYAAPPVGPLRWALPQPAASWEGVRPTNAFGDRCVQTLLPPDMLLFRSLQESEDCLSLSVWTAAAGSEDPALPVMVFIHGGGLFVGAGDEKRYDGAALASKGVVLVNLNHRLGALGFFAHPDLTAEATHHASGNYGLLDQIAALTWVRDNIREFGGDPGNVTIFGFSSGSVAVCALMASPLAAGLFHKAIGQSGACPLDLKTRSEAERVGTDLAARVGATSLAELRDVPAADLVETMYYLSPRAVIDGYVLTESPWDTYTSGAQRHVPLLAGWNSAEIGFGKWIEVHAATSGSPVYRYLFDHVVPTAEGDPPADSPGAAHGSEVEFVFHTLDSRALRWRDADRRVADLMTSYWTNFAKTGNPNGDGLPVWPAWGAGHLVMRLKDDPTVEPEADRDQYELFDRTGTQRPAR